MSNYKFSAALVKKCGDLGITEDVSLLAGIKRLLDDVVPAIEANNTLITAFEKLGKGKMYECPHCKSDTLLDFGKCHICDGDLFIETLNTVAKSEPKKAEKVKKEAKPETAAKKVEADVKLKRDPSDFRKEELETLLEKTKDKKNKEAALKLIAETLSIVLPNPDVMNASSMRNEIVPVIEKLLKAAKPMPKVVEVDEDELLAEPDDEIEIDDEDDAPAPAAPKKIAKEAKKSKVKEVPADDDDDLEFEDDEEEKPVTPAKSSKKETKKTAKPAPKEEVEDDDDAIEIDDEDDAVTIDEDDEQVAEAEVEDDVFELDESEDDETDF
jgi:hypothetical protein